MQERSLIYVNPNDYWSLPGVMVFIQQGDGGESTSYVTGQVTRVLFPPEAEPGAPTTIFLRRRWRGSSVTSNYDSLYL